MSTPDLVLAALGLAFAVGGGMVAAWHGSPEPDRSAGSIAAAARALRTDR